MPICNENNANLGYMDPLILASFSPVLTLSTNEEMAVVWFPHWICIVRHVMQQEIADFGKPTHISYSLVFPALWPNGISTSTVGVGCIGLQKNCHKTFAEVCSFCRVVFVLSWTSEALRPVCLLCFEHMRLDTLVQLRTSRLSHVKNSWELQ